MQSDTFFCIYCMNQFKDEADYLLHSIDCTSINEKFFENEPANKKRSKIQQKSSIKTSGTYGITKDELLECEICSKAYTLNELELYQRHIFNGECLLIESTNKIVSKPAAKVKKENKPTTIKRPSRVYSQQIQIGRFGDDLENDLGILQFFRYPPRNELNNILLQENIVEGLSKSEIELLNTHNYKKKEGSETEVCNICQDDLRNDDLVIRLPCFHAYHSKELIKWLKVSIYCPSCKTNIKSEINHK